MALDDVKDRPAKALVRPPQVEPNRSDLFIDGAFTPALAQARAPLVSPATEQVIGSIVDAGEADVDRAVRAARAALPAWRRLTPQARGQLLGRLADLFQARMDDIAALVSWQNGAVISRSRGSNGFAPLGIYRAHAEMAAAFAFEEMVESPGGRVLNVAEPVGVLGAIVPWNAPQGLLAGKLAPSLLAGCTVVVKPSPETSLDALLLAELIVEAGFPPGVVNIVTGGRETGALLVSHPGVDMISFTGSTVAGRAVAAACGQNLKEVTTELGGKSAAIVLDDADLDRFSAALIDTCLPNTGQVCYSSTRILAPASRLDEVTQAVTATLRAAQVGDPMDPDSRFGPLVSARQRERVEGYIASGKAEGARVALGGGRPSDLPVGYYVEPTVFVDVAPHMRIYREEIFGPVVSIVGHQGDEDAVRMANDSDYGLGGSVFSADLDRAVRVAREVETGALLINGAGMAKGTTMVGRKASGVGGGDVLRSFLQTKSIVLPPG